MKIRFRHEFLNHIIYIVFTKVELVTGICSKLNMDKDKSLKSNILKDKHIPLFDYDNVSLKYLERNFNIITNKPVYIMSDKDNHYRVICTEIIEWREYLDWMHRELSNGLDYQFYRWSVIRGYSTIRLTNKEGRKNNDIIAILNCNNEELKFIDKKVTFESYQADKDGIKVDLKW